MKKRIKSPTISAWYPHVGSIPDFPAPSKTWQCYGYPQIAMWKYLMFRPNSHWLINEKSPKNNISQFRIPSFFPRKISYLHPFIVASSYTRAPWLVQTFPHLAWLWSGTLPSLSSDLLGVPPEYFFPAQSQEKKSCQHEPGCGVRI